MRHQETHYEIVEEDEHGFNPCCFSCASLAEAEKELARHRHRWPGSNAFIVRTTMTRVSKKNSPLHLQAI